jgi:hypothetical protein
LGSRLCLFADERLGQLVFPLIEQPGHPVQGRRDCTVGVISPRFIDVLDRLTVISRILGRDRLAAFGSDPVATDEGWGSHTPDSVRCRRSSI